MNKNLATLLVIPIVALMTPLSSIGQTPDGQTPADESVCEVLKSDGITKGLYGLCVAFCEAQDLASMSFPLTDEEIESLGEQAPAGSILTAYNRKMNKAMNPNDIPMPCIEKKVPCPCASSEEIAAIDGLSDLTGLPMLYSTFGDFSNVAVIGETNGPDHIYTNFKTQIFPTTNSGLCEYKKFVVDPYFYVRRYFLTTVPEDNILHMSMQQAQACMDLAAQFR